MAYAPTQPGTDTSDIGVANMQSLTLFDAEPYLPSPGMVAHSGAEDSGGVASGAVGHPAGGNPTFAVIALLGGLVLLGFLRNSSEHLRSNTIALNAFNFTLMILTVMIGFALVKVVVAKYPIPGITQLVHAA